MAARDIAIGDELLLDYGDMYWGAIAQVESGEDGDDDDDESESVEDEVIEELGDMLSGVSWGSGLQLSGGLSLGQLGKQ